MQHPPMEISFGQVRKIGARLKAALKLYMRLLLDLCGADELPSKSVHVIDCVVALVSSRGWSDG
eukprot:5472623-Amphidinium_carterae.4